MSEVSNFEGENKRYRVRRQVSRRGDDEPAYSIPDIVQLLEINKSNSSSTFTISQALTTLFAILTILGSLVSIYVSLNSQVTTLKVSTNLIFQQISKDQISSNLIIQDFKTKTDQNLKEITTKIEALSQTNKKSK